MKSNKLFRWIYGLFMLLPMLAIGVKCLYVTFNKNAKDSYYGETINEVIYQNVNINDLKVGTNYTLYFSNESVTSGSRRVYATNIYDNGIYREGYEYFSLFLSNGNPTLGMYGTGKTTIYHVPTTTNTFTITFDYVSIADTAYNGDYPQFQEKVYNNYSYLDNAFYYAIDEFNDCGFNRVDFVSFFDFFNTQNNIYITFANTYINYMLFVSLAFFIPRVLMWFVGYAYGLTDGFSGRKWW